MRAENARALRAPPDVVEAMEQRRRSDMFEVLPENWPIVQLFLAVQTQWRVGLAGAIGLDYAAVESDIRMSRREVTPAMWDGLKTMERAALAEFNEQRNQ